MDDAAWNRWSLFSAREEKWLVLQYDTFHRLDNNLPDFQSISNVNSTFQRGLAERSGPERCERCAALQPVGEQVWSQSQVGH